MVMVEPAFLALMTTPSMTGSAAEPTLPVSAAADWARAGAARANWNRTAAVAALEASNAFRTRMAFPSGLELVDSDAGQARQGRYFSCRRVDLRARCFKIVPVVTAPHAGTTLLVLFPDAVQRAALAERCAAEPGSSQPPPLERSPLEAGTSVVRLNPAARPLRSRPSDCRRPRRSPA